MAYELAIRPLQIINPIINNVSFPIFARIQHENERLKQGYLQVVEMIALLNMPVYFGMFAVAAPLVTLFLGDGWDNTAGLLQILVFIGLFASLGNPIGSLLLAKGRADIGFWMNIFILFIRVVAISIGLHWGTTGVAWCLLCSRIVFAMPVSYWIYWRVIHLRPLEYIKSFATIFFIAANMALIVFGLNQFVDIHLVPVQLGVSILLGTLLYAGGIWLFKRDLLQEVLSMAFRRSSLSNI
jgi:O-antigen/teichoic acid export membrane protein